MPTAADAGVLLVAAGRGVRAADGGDLPKQFRPIAGVPMLVRSLTPFLRHPRIGSVVIALPADAAAAPPAFLAPLLSERVRLVAGGETRQASVALALAALPPALPLVLVHDAARPFVDAALIDRVLTVAADGACAVPGQPLAETVKETDTSGLVVRTVPRERLVAVQTPQAFPRAMLETAHHRARSDAGAAPATDDAALCERLGYPVRVVAGSPWNLKLTTADDFRAAEAWVAQGVTG